MKTKAAHLKAICFRSHTCNRFRTLLRAVAFLRYLLKLRKIFLIREHGHCSKLHRISLPSLFLLHDTVEVLISEGNELIIRCPRDNASTVTHCRLVIAETTAYCVHRVWDYVHSTSFSTEWQSKGSEP